MTITEVETTTFELNIVRAQFYNTGAAIGHNRISKIFFTRPESKRFTRSNKHQE